MVLQQAVPRTRAFDVDTAHPDPVRIVGLTGTIALNALVLGVLLVPASRDTVTTLSPERALDFSWITTPPPPPALPPVHVEVVAPQPASTPVQPRPVSPTGPALDARTTVDAGPAMPSPTIDIPVAHAGPVIADPAPVSGTVLRYAHAPAPAYPRAALAAGAEGVVVLEVHVGRDGRPLAVQLHRSSGHRDLDRAALRHMHRHWTFQPALRNGVPVEAIGLVPIAFSLSEG